MRKKLMGAALAAAMITPAMASDAIGNNKWYLNAGVGYHLFDGFWDLDSEPAAVLSVEQRLQNNWGVEVSGTYAEADNAFGNTAGDSEVSFFSVNGIRYFPVANDRIEPYAAMGLGMGIFNPDNIREEEVTQGNVGGGVRYALSGPVSLRADARYYYGFDHETNDGVVTIGLSYAFGGDSKPAPAPAPERVVNDSDADGVVDSMDQCPGTPAGIAVDAKGCALDKDGDGVPNYRDKCPNTPAGRQVDKFGCKFVLKHTESIKMDVKFALNSDAIPTSEMSELKKVADFMKQFGGVKAVVEGHSDSTGAAAYNKQLSQRRADAVRNTLIKEFGIDASRLSAIGYGEERPIADNSTKEGRKANRRVVAVMEAEVAE